MFSDVWSENAALFERFMELHFKSTNTILWLEKHSNYMNYVEPKIHTQFKHREYGSWIFI